MVKNLQFELVPAGTVIMREGEVSNEKFYVILSGECSVVKRQHANYYEKQNLEQERKERRGSRRKLRSSSPVTTDQDESNEGPQEQSKALGKLQRAMNISVFERYKAKSDMSNVVRQAMAKAKFQATGEDLENLIASFGIVVKVLRKNETFGEAALLQTSNQKRNATIIANMDCQFITLSKKDFTMIAHRFQRGNKSKLEFLREAIPDIANISGRTILEDYLYSFKNLYLKKGAEVVTAGTPGDEIFVLVEGQCEVEMKEAGPAGSDGGKAITVARIDPGAMIGDELIFESTKEYKYTIRVIQSLLYRRCFN